MVKVKKFFKKLLVVALVLLLLYALLYIYIWGFVRERVRVHYIASYETNTDMDYMTFYGYYTVGDVKEQIQEEYWKRNFGEMEGLYEKLDKLDDNTRMVISTGSGIRYFWILRDRSEYDGFIRVAYQSKEPQNKIYFYTTEFSGLIVDFKYY